MFYHERKKNIRIQPCNEMVERLDEAKRLPIQDDEDDHFLRIKLDEFKRNYDSIFSWDIKERTGGMQDFLSIIREKCNTATTTNVTKFDVQRFYLTLIICYELYVNEKYEESAKEIQDVIEFMDSCKFDVTHEPYAAAYHHIARSTCAYIAVSMNKNAEKILENIKPVIDFNPEEKSAVCSIKARVFMKYAPKGNVIGLEYANEARDLIPTEPEWICIWLLAKGRVRRYIDDVVCKLPYECEIDAVETLLCVEKPKPEYLARVSDIYLQMAWYFNTQYNYNESCKYFKLASDILRKAIIMLLEENEANCLMLCYCFSQYTRLPEKLHSKSLTDQLIEKLQSLNNLSTDFALGLYYHKIEKDYEKAKRYYSRAMMSGTFRCTINLFRVECLLQPTGEFGKFQYIQTLNIIYDAFENPKRRLLIVSQILIYYHSCERNAQELMRYLKLYMDQDIEDERKKMQLIIVWPMLKDIFFSRGQFLDELTSYVENITKNHDWNAEEKQIVNDTYNRFKDMLKVNSISQRYDNRKNNSCEISYDDPVNKDHKVKKLQHNSVKELNWRTKQGGSMHFNNTSSNEINNQERNTLSNSCNRRNYLQNSNEDRNQSWRNRKGSGVFNGEFQKTVTNYPPAGCNSRPKEQNEIDGKWKESFYSDSSIFGPRRDLKPNTKFP